MPWVCSPIVTYGHLPKAKPSVYRGTRGVGCYVISWGYTYLWNAGFDIRDLKKKKRIINLQSLGWSYHATLNIYIYINHEK